MKNLKTNTINVDLEKYVVYNSEHYGKIIVVEISEANRIMQLMHRHKKFENIPDEEVVFGIFLEYDETDDAYKIINTTKQSLQINKIESAWVRTS